VDDGDDSAYVGRWWVGCVCVGGVWRDARSEGPTHLVCLPEQREREPPLAGDCGHTV